VTPGAPAPAGLRRCIYEGKSVLFCRNVKPGGGRRRRLIRFQEFYQHKFACSGLFQPGKTVNSLIAAQTGSCYWLAGKPYG